MFTENIIEELINRIASKEGYKFIHPASFNKTELAHAFLYEDETRLQRVDCNDLEIFLNNELHANKSLFIVEEVFIDKQIWSSFSNFEEFMASSQNNTRLLLNDKPAVNNAILDLTLGFFTQHTLDVLPFDKHQTRESFLISVIDELLDTNDYNRDYLFKLLKLLSKATTLKDLLDNHIDLISSSLDEVSIIINNISQDNFNLIKDNTFSSILKSDLVKYEDISVKIFNKVTFDVENNNIGLDHIDFLMQQSSIAKTTENKKTILSILRYALNCHFSKSTRNLNNDISAEVNCHTDSAGYMNNNIQYYETPYPCEQDSDNPFNDAHESYNTNTTNNTCANLNPTRNNVRPLNFF